MTSSARTPPALAQLIRALRVLPGVGVKSATRMAYHLLQRDREGAARLARQLLDALEHVGHCRRCNTFCETELCDICADTQRTASQVCVVEMPADLERLEQTRCHDGYYYVLMGHVSPLDGVGVHDVALHSLLQRVLDGEVTEVIIATNYTAEGEATAHIIAQLLRDYDIKVTRIARGLPVGGELEFIDPGTLAQAFYERRKL